MESKPIYPCLWFDQNAKQAADFYCTVFDNAKIIDESQMVVIFEINGTKFMGLNGGAKYTHSPAVSFVIECETQKEIDHYWERLGENGRYDRCGWLTDLFGISWQIVPTVLPKLMANPDKRQNVMEAFLKMQKFDTETLLNA
jgi:predicted 3-demethylubiquinone-9 3-methyltransferase (glyoxalase superfamily)